MTISDSDCSGFQRICLAFFIKDDSQLVLTRDVMTLIKFLWMFIVQTRALKRDSRETSYLSAVIITLVFAVKISFFLYSIIFLSCFALKSHPIFSLFLFNPLFMI